MINVELLNYIKSEMSKGQSEEAIRDNLISGGGWREEDLNEAFKAIHPFQTEMPLVVPKPPEEGKQDLGV